MIKEIFSNINRKNVYEFIGQLFNLQSIPEKVVAYCRVEIKSSENTINIKI